jgi:SAM-dependent methyltransferase
MPPQLTSSAAMRPNWRASSYKRQASRPKPNGCPTRSRSEPDGAPQISAVARSAFWICSPSASPQGLVVGLEREARFFAMACAEAKRRGLGNVRVVAGDALNPDLQEGPFDFVHERLVLMNMPQAQQRTMVSQMLALLKPGGSIALQDCDRVLRVLLRTSILGDFVQSPTPTPSVPAVATARRVLPWLLRSAGAIHASFVDVGDSRRTHHLGLLAVMEDKILALGRFGRTEFAEHKQVRLEHLAHPDTLLIDHLLVQAWVKPDEKRGIDLFAPIRGRVVLGGRSAAA